MYFNILVNDSCGTVFEKLPEFMYCVILGHNFVPSIIDQAFVEFNLKAPRAELHLTFPQQVLRVDQL